MSDFQPRTKKGQPPHSTTGVARANSLHCTACIDQPAGSQAGARSATMASAKTGRARITLAQKRRVMSSRSRVSSTGAALCGSSAMPHFGQLPG
jgi:hypothetical protein